ncbi:MAG TPA: hypothetical protein VJ835_02615, partial [Fimbriimonadaceae bacterium]|nr:hypothetical protein [Fimbriimonadaceae bacterium]
TDTPARSASAESLADLRKRELRDAKAYVIPSGQDSMAVERFLQSLEENGIQIGRNRGAVRVNGKVYPPGTVVIRCDQPFRPHILDMFEPQDHPNDIPAPGAAPIPPYDSAGYTLALQMGVKFDRILDTPNIETNVLYAGSDPSVILVSPPGGWAGNMAYSGTYAEVAKRMAAGESASIYHYPSISAIGSKEPIANPATTYRLSMPRVALWDRYGGSMESGWTRWILEKFGMPYKVVFPQELDAGNLNTKFDAIVFVDGAIPQELRPANMPNTEGIPEQYRPWLGSVNQTTLSRLKEFLENGGSIITIGSSTNLAKHLGLPIENHLMADGKPLPRTKYYVPGSILQVKVDSSKPLAWGYEDHANVMFDNSPVFKITDTSRVTPVAWFDTDRPLISGWAWGQNYLKDGVAIAEAPVGKGKLYLFGPEILYRGQSWGTFRFFLNSLLLSRAEKLGL